MYEKTGVYHMVQGVVTEEFIGHANGETSTARLRKLEIDSNLEEMIQATEINCGPVDNAVELPLDDSSKAVIHCNCARIHATVDPSQVERVAANSANANPVAALTYVEEAGTFRLEHVDGSMRFIRLDTVVEFDVDTDVLRDDEASRLKCAFCPFR